MNNKQRNNIRILSLSILACLGFAGGAQAQETAATDESGFKIGLDYTGDVFSVVDGGVETGTTYTGLANVNFDFTAAQWSWHANVLLPHGDSPTGEHAGDLGAISNIDTGGLDPRLQEFWFQRNFDGGNLRVGMLTLDGEFWFSENSGMFINGSLGAPVIVTGNLPNASAFPTATLGARVEWNVGDKSLMRVALVDGDAGDPEVDNRHGTDVDLGSGQGYLLAVEHQTDWTAEGGLPHMLKIGGFVHSGDFIDFSDLSTSSNAYGVYAVLDKPLTARTGWFGRVGYTKSSVAAAPIAFETGITVQEAFGSKGTFGVALSHIDLNDDLDIPAFDVDVTHETILELTYDYPVNDHFTIQPDIQYIMEPGGVKGAADDALAIGIRAKLSF